MKTNRSTFSIFAGFTLTVLGGMIFDIGGLAAGRAATLLNSLMENVPWVFLIYPLLLTVRGDINGILTGKLGSALHLGIIKPVWRKNSSTFLELIFMIVFMSIYDAILIGTVTSVLGFLLKLFSNPIEVLQIYVITLTTFILTATISMLITFLLTFFIFKKNGDPDVYAYPITSSVNDILITIVFFLICWLYQPWKDYLNLHYYIGIPIIVFVLIVFIFSIVKFKDSKYFLRGIKQSIPVLTLTNLIAAGTGTVLATLSDTLSAVPILLVFYPAIISTVGSQNSILANTTSTKLHLGSIKPSFKSIRSKEFSITYGSIITSAVLIILLMSIIGVLLFPEGITFGLYWLILGLLLLSNFLSFFLISFIALSASFLSFRFGLDPDNLVNPLLSSSADLVTTIVLVFLFKLLYVV